MTPFYLCTNPEVIMPDEVVACIYGYKKPRFFALVEKVGVTEPVSKISYKGANVIFSYGLNGEKPQEYLLAVNDNIDNAPYGQLTKALRKAVEWYIKVRALEAVAKRVDFSMPGDYSPAVPYLQAMHYHDSDEFLLSYGHGVKGFSSLDEMETFMREQLKLSDDIVGHGEISTSQPG